MSTLPTQKRAGRDVAVTQRPLYRAIADTLRRQLANGSFSPGAKLPTVRKLATQFKVSVVTVSKALRALESEGQVTCIPTVGAFVPATSVAKGAPAGFPALSAL